MLNSKLSLCPNLYRWRGKGIEGRDGSQIIERGQHNLITTQYNHKKCAFTCITRRTINTSGQLYTKQALPSKTWFLHIFLTVYISQPFSFLCCHVLHGVTLVLCSSPFIYLIFICGHLEYSGAMWNLVKNLRLMLAMLYFQW